MALLGGLALSLSAGTGAWAAEPTEAPATRVKHYTASYTVNPDGAHVESRSWSMAVLKPEAVATAARTAVSYDRQLQKVTLVEAYTLKADGRKLKVPKHNVQEMPDAASGLQDMNVQFPDVAVGDTVVLSYRVTTSKPMFARQFSINESFPKTDTYDDVRIRVDVPASLWTQDQARGFREVKREKKAGRQIVEWAWDNKQAQAAKPPRLSAYELEDEAGVLFSTFKGHGDLAKAYGEGAHAKAMVTPKVQQLADQLTQEAGAKAPREVAKALYDWVTLNIGNAGTCLRLGSVVPRDVDAVIDSRKGDCKDHATLLQALLKAKGIASTQALINAGNAYALPKVPVVSMVNQVIGYVPSLNLYLDTTSDSVPFGMLPFMDEGKPVLLAEGHQEGLKTPVSPLGFNQQVMKTDVVVQPDGSATGTVEVALRGLFAVNSRMRLRQLTQVQSANMVKGFFESGGLKGSGSMLKENARALRDTYGYRAQFKIEQWLKLPGPGNFTIAPLFYSESPVADYVAASSQPVVEGTETPCSSGHSVEEYRYQLPPNVQVESLPKDVKLEGANLSYSATYHLKDQVLTVKRVFDDRTAGNVCNAAHAQAYKDFAAQAVPDSTAQVVFK
jgi:transglutaminase-like putative cysteine protease